MTIANALDRISEWLEEHVCVNVKLKPRSPEDGLDTNGYEYELVHPSVFPLYVPSKSSKPPNVKATSPAICVQIIEGNDQVMERKRTMNLRLTFSAWDPGLHGPDLFTPTDVEHDGFGRVYERGEAGSFVLTHTGWRDVWNFVDTALRVIENDRTLGGYPLDPTTSVKWGAYDEDGAIADYYPFWFAWIELSVKAEIITADPALENLL